MITGKDFTCQDSFFLTELNEEAYKVRTQRGVHVDADTRGLGSG